MKKLLIVMFIFSLNVNAQDVSGAIGASSSVHVASNHQKTVYEIKPKKVLYVFKEDIKVENTFILFRGKEYQVFKDKNNKLYFFAGKRVYFKTIK